jgi:DNA-binding transcriptional LysR family regulator
MDSYRVNLYQLAVFTEVVDRGNLTRAGDAFMVSQPVISRIVHTLEREYNTKLLMRQGQTVVPTESGAALHAFARDVLRGQDHTRRVLRELRNEGGRLRLGISSSALDRVAPYVADLMARNPTADVSVVVDSTDAIADAVRNLDLDAAIAVHMAQSERGVASARLWSEEMIPIVSPTNPLANPDHDDSAWEDLTVIATQSIGHVTYVVDNLLPNLPLQHEYAVVQSGTPTFVSLLVQAGAGISVLPHAAVVQALNDGRLVRLPGIGPLEPVELRLIRHPRSTELPLLRRFLHLLG